MPHTWSATLWHDDIAPADHTADGLAELLWQYDDKPRLRAFLSALLARVQSTELVAYAAMAGRGIYSAIGAQLDVLGKIVGQARGELTDDEYRLMILGRILVNRSSGTIPELVDLLELLGVDAGALIDTYPVEVRVDVVDTPHGDIIADLIADWAAGGVRVTWVWNEHAEAEAFAMSSQLDADDVTTTGGFGDLDGVTQTTGGYLSGDETT